MAIWYGLFFEFVFFAVAIFLLAYLIPAGFFHLIFYTGRRDRYEAMRIQERRASPKSVRREVKASLVAILLLAAYATLLYQSIKAGATQVYFDWNDYGWHVPIVGFLVAVVVHDTWFYWTHRLMHVPLLFRLFHSDHHKSVTPTPWAILSVQPLETVFQFGVFALLTFLVPLHPATLAAYLLFDSMVNAAGHSGYEFVPAKQMRHPVLKYLNACTHHDLHHRKFDKNFGQYFNIWDRLMGPFHDREEPASAAR